jgi:hypothetical protein
MNSSNEGMVRLALLLPPPHKHYDDHAEDERTQRIEHGYEIVATGDVDDDSDKRGDSVDAPRFDRFGRLTGLPLPSLRRFLSNSEAGKSSSPRMRNCVW